MKKIVLLFILTIFNLSLVPKLLIVNAQDYQFSLPKVTISGQTKNTRVEGDETKIDEKLSTEDDLRFAWSNLDIDSKYIDKPTENGGFIKAYIKEVKEENFITNITSFPVKIETLVNKLNTGENKVVFQLIVNNKDINRKVVLNFNYEPKRLKPKINIISPLPKTAFGKKFETKFNLELENFKIRKDLKQVNYGLVKIYHTSITESNFINSLSEGKDTDIGSKIEFSSNILEEGLNKLTDNLEQKLYFVPFDSVNGLQQNLATEFQIIVNYQETLDLKKPSIEFINVSDNNNSITALDQIKFRIINFKVLNFDLRNKPSSNEGYVQILVNDKLHKLTFEKYEFSIKELIPNYNQDKVNIKLQLVDVDFLQLNPEVNTEIDLFLKKDISTNNFIVETTNWKLLIILATIVLIAGSALYIVFRS